MDINISGELYVYFIRNIFELNKKIGIEIIIDCKKSNNMIIDGLKRLNFMNNNKIIILNENIPNNFDTYSTKYIGNFSFTSFNNLNNDNIPRLKLNKMDIVEKDKIIIPHKSINNKVFLNKYSTGKNKTVNDIMQIINNDSK